MLHYPPLKKIKILLNLKQSISQFHQNVLLVQLMNHLICLSSRLELQPLSSHCTFCPRQKVPCTRYNLQLSLIVKELLTASLQIPCYLRTLWKMKPTRALSKPLKGPGADGKSAIISLLGLPMALGSGWLNTSEFGKRLTPVQGEQD